MMAEHERRSSQSQQYWIKIKKDLVDSFHGFAGNSVSQASIELARSCIQYGRNLHGGYEHVAFDDILELNKATPSYLTMMTSAYDLLLKYVLNLLKDRRPLVWRSIKTNNTAFKARVSCMRGSTDILKRVGYSEEKDNVMCFPDDVVEPNKAMLCVIAAELLMAKFEIEQMNSSALHSANNPPLKTVTTGLNPMQLQQTYQRPHTDQMYAHEMNQQMDQFSFQGPQGQRQGQSFRQVEASSHTSQHNQQMQGHSYYNGTTATPQTSGAVRSYLENNQEKSSLPPERTVPNEWTTKNPSKEVAVRSVATVLAKPTESLPGDLNRPIPKPRTKLVSPCLEPPSASPPSVRPPPISELPEEDTTSPHVRRRSFSGEINTSRQSSSSSADGTEGSLSRPNSGDITTNSVTVANRVKSIRERRENIRKGLENKSETSVVMPTQDNFEPISKSERVRRSATEIHRPVGKTSQREDQHSLAISPEIQRKYATDPSFSGLSIDIKKPPGMKRLAPVREPLTPPREEEFEVQSQTRVEVPQVEKKEPVKTPPEVQPTSTPLRFCSGCKNKLQVDHSFCGYCGQQNNTPGSQPPPNLSLQAAQPPDDVTDDNIPLRASHHDALEAEEVHKRTHVFNIEPSIGFTPVPRNAPLEAALPQAQQQLEPRPPDIPPRPNPRQNPGDSKQPLLVLHDQTNHPASSRPLKYPTLTPTPRTPPLPPKQPRSVNAMNPASPRTPPLPAKQPRSVKAMNPAANVGSNEDCSGSSRKSQKEKTGTEFLSMPGIAHLVKKEKAYHDKQRRDGTVEDELKPLNELKEARQSYVASECERKKNTPVRTKPNKPKTNDKFPVVNVMTGYGNPVKYKTDYSKNKMLDEIQDEGSKLLRAVKVCTPHGYTLDEIQVAFNSCPHGSSELDYLQYNWRDKVEITQRNVSTFTTPNGQGVGVPGTMETREALAKSGGDGNKAEVALLKEREKRVTNLLKKMERLRTINKVIPEISWEGAVQVLSANYMDVDMAFYALQCDWLHPLYDYIFDEKKPDVMIHQKEMEQIKEIIKRKDVSSESLLRLLMSECRFNNEETANVVLQLLEEVEKDGEVTYPLQYYVDAAKDHKDLEKARNFLMKECEVCLSEYAVHEFVSLPGCEHSVCRTCFKDHYTIVIKEKEVKHFNCLNCGKPDMANEEITQGVYLEIFMQLIHEYLDDELYHLCSNKLRDFNLISNENFIWCANSECGSGFIHEGQAIYVQCPNCVRLMCRKCKKPWEPTHENVSCEEFAQWKIDNDPTAQEQGLAAHLHANGIECPQCRFKYDLARGGCMHFKCVKCPNEFCSGCGQSFKQGKDCGKLESCKKKGLHAHHPRDCLFFMRDFDIKELQDFLGKHNIPFDTKPKEKPAAKEGKPAQEEPGADVIPAEGEGVDEAVVQPAPGCKVMLQKETLDGLKDEECGKVVTDDQAGICETHYKEYLVDLINKNKLDPITMYNTDKVKVMLTREDMPVPDKDEDEEEDEDYRDRLIEHVKENLGLRHEKRKVRGKDNVQPGVEQPRPEVPRAVLVQAH